MRIILLLIVAIAIAPAATAQADIDHAGVKAQKPNIVFILADDLGWGELGCFGNDFNETPNLDRLAAHGIKFTNAYAAGPVCSPTRASIMTGQYPARVRITDFLSPSSGRLLEPAKHVTINEVLSHAGYRTGLVGKWHLDTDFKENRGGPANHGFDEVIGTETKYIADGDYFFPYDKINTFTSGEVDEYLTDRQSEEAAGFIERNKDRPFFLYVSYYSVHTRLAAPEALVAKYKRKFDARYGKGQAEKIFEGENKRHQAGHGDNPYLAAMLESMDTGVGTIMRSLADNGLAGNTLLIFMSDNGGANRVANNGGLRLHKSWLYEGGIRSPLIMRLPGTIKAGTETDVPVASHDLYPTFADLAGARIPAAHTVDGVSLLSTVTTGAVPDREALFWHYPSETGKWENRMASAVRKGNYKLIHFYQSGRTELYDLKKDPQEKHNLVDEMPDRARDLHRMLDTWKKEVNAEPPGILNTD